MRNRLGAILEERYGDCYRKDRAKQQATRADGQLPEAKPAGSKKDSRPAKKGQRNEPTPAPEPPVKENKKRPQRKQPASKV